jgi:hypothetical protein
MTQSTTLAAPTRRVRYRWRIGLAVCVTLAIGLAAGFWYLSWAEERDFQEALAETDRLDPGWRLDAIEAARPIIRPEENSALVVIEIHKACTLSWLGERLENNMVATPLNVPFDAEATQALQKLVDEHAQAAGLALRLAEMPRGRYPSTYDPQTASFSFEYLQYMRHTAHIVQLTTLHAIQQGDEVRAAELCRSGLNTARSAAAEGSLIALLVRVACVEIGLSGLERTLAMTTPPPAELQKLQDVIQREIDDPRLTVSMRGERALGADMLEAVRDGRQKRSTLVPATKGAWQKWLADLLPGTVGFSRANHLRAMNDLVEASKLPVERQLTVINEKCEAWEGRDAVLTSALPAFRKGTAAHVRNQAKLRCAVVAVAAERYRQEHHAWPAALDTLVRSGHLKEVPVDPYDGKPLRYRRLPDGPLFYSVGVDGVDDGGTIDRSNPIAPGTDIGFRLWDVESRRKTMP